MLAEGQFTKARLLPAGMYRYDSSSGSNLCLTADHELKHKAAMSKAEDMVVIRLISPR